MIRVRGEESAHRRLQSTASVEALVGGASLGFAPLSHASAQRSLAASASAATVLARLP